MDLVHRFTEVPLTAISIRFATLKNAFVSWLTAALRCAGNSALGTRTLVAAILMIPDFTDFSVPAGPLRALLVCRACDPLLMAGACVAAILRSPALAQGTVTAMRCRRDGRADTRIGIIAQGGGRRGQGLASDQRCEYQGDEAEQIP